MRITEIPVNGYKQEPIKNLTLKKRKKV